MFTNLTEDSIKELIEETQKWPLKPSKYTYRLTHPIKKNLFGPDKIFLTEDIKIFFISPKMLLVEVVNNSTGFPYCDSFFNTVQYVFETKFKYIPAEDIFNFITTCSINFKITFIKSCMFKGMIETEAYKESEENIRFITYDQIKTVVNNQIELFKENGFIR